LVYKRKKTAQLEKEEKSILRAKIREDNEKLENAVIKNNQKKSKKKQNKQSSESIKSEVQKTVITQEQWEWLRETAKRAQIHISRWYFESARLLIVEWLALKKEDKELNLLLADVYEREKKYQNAAYIYKDVIDIYGEELYTLQRLWNIHVLLDETQKAIEIYEIAQLKDKSNTEILDILAHLYIEIWEFKKALKYAWAYLKEKPRNAEKLSIKAYALEKLWKTLEAIKCYELVLQVQPYNTEIQDRVKALEKKQNEAEQNDAKSLQSTPVQDEKNSF